MPAKVGRQGGLFGIRRLALLSGTLQAMRETDNMVGHLTRAGF